MDPSSTRLVSPTLSVRCEEHSALLTPATPVRIGRDVDSHIVLDDSRISRQHLSLTDHGDGTIEIADTSRNGTWLHGRRLDGPVVVPVPLTLRLGAPEGFEVRVAPASRDAAIATSPFSTVLATQRRPSGEAPQSQSTLTIGRDPGCEVVIDDPLVSRRHARLVATGDGFAVRDLSSSNGTYLNSQRVTTAHMGPADVLTVGRTRLKCQDGQLVVARPERPTLVANQLTFTLPQGKTLLHDVSFELPEATLLAVIGPSGAGKSTLLKALTGSQPATSGQVVYEDQDLYANYQGLCRRIGVVPQDDLVHRQLTVRQALDYAARLRLPHDYTADQRDAEVERVLADLDLSAHGPTPVARLSGGQRKRVSVALELLTQPNLLLLDEPTSGLDPNLDRAVMRLLRGQADTGRVVIVITHSVANLSLCDRVLLLAPGGRVAYFGPPEGVRAQFGSDNYADVFETVTADPLGCQARFAAERPSHPRPAPELPGQRKRVRDGSAWSQLRTLTSRHTKVICADHNYVIASVLMPVLIGLMALLIGGDAGFGPAGRDHPNEAATLMTIMIIGAAFMGVSASIRELVTERPIFLRERAVGLSQRMYLASKVTVLVGLTAVQSALLTVVVLARKPGPGEGVLLGPGWFELGVACFGTALASSLIGLAISALVSTGEQVMPAMVVHVMAQLVLSGGIITVSGRRLLEILAAPTPGRWGFAQAAATVDLQKVRIPGPGAPEDWLWDHTATSWSTSAAALAGICVVSWVLTRVALHRQRAEA